jgi:hypothetical protein
VGFHVDIADADLLASVNNALMALDAVATIDASAPDVAVVEAALSYGCAASFSVLNDGSLQIAIDPNQSSVPGLDFLHEVGHYVDWALLSPQGEMASASLPPEFSDWLHHVTGSSACRELLRIATAPQMVRVALDDGTHVDMVEDSAHARYALDAPEVFARSFCQFVTVRSGNQQLIDELVQALRNHYPEQWREADFEPIAASIEDLLEDLT